MSQTMQAAGADRQTDDPEGLVMALSAVQLAAVLEGESIEPGGTVGNRLIGGLRVLGCGAELFGAGVLLAAPEPTMLTKVGGVALGAHGVDQCVTGAGQIWSGHDARSLTERTASSFASRLGASRGTARNVGVAADILVPIGPAMLAGAVRAGAIRAGRISLMRHEAAAGSRYGGHTLERHVGIDEVGLRRRLVETASKRRPPSMISSFDDLANAERSVTRALQANKERIAHWAQSAGRNNLVIEMPAGRAIGLGVVRNGGQAQRLSRVKVVIRKEAYNGMPHFILTAFPI